MKKKLLLTCILALGMLASCGEKPTSQTSQETSEPPVSEVSSQEASQEQSQEASQEVSQEASQEVSQETSQEASHEEHSEEEHSQEVSQESSQETSQETSGDIEQTMDIVLTIDRAIEQGRTVFVHAWGGDEAAETVLAQADGTTIRATIRADRTGLVLGVLKEGETELSGTWDNVAYQSNDLVPAATVVVEWKNRPAEGAQERVVPFKLTYAGLKEGEELHVLGDFNGWTASEATKMTASGEGVYELSITMLDGNHEFKFVIKGAALDWTSLNASNRKVTVVEGVKVEETIGSQEQPPVEKPVVSYKIGDADAVVVPEDKYNEAAKEYQVLGVELEEGTTVVFISDETELPIENEGFAEGFVAPRAGSYDFYIKADKVWITIPKEEAQAPVYKIVGLAAGETDEEKWAYAEGLPGKEVEDEAYKFQLKWELDLEAEVSFKISDGADAWYGADKLEESSAGAAESESSSNIKLAAGKYTVYFKIYNDDHIGIYIAPAQSGEGGGGGEETPTTLAMTLTIDRAIEEGRTVLVHAWGGAKEAGDYAVVIDAEDPLKLTAEIDADRTGFLVAVLKDGETEYGAEWVNVAYQSNDLVPAATVEVGWKNRPAEGAQERVVPFKLTYTGLKEGEELHVLGDFNGWAASEATKMTASGEGVYELSITMLEGDHEFKFVIKGAALDWTSLNASNRKVTVAEGAKVEVVIESEGGEGGEEHGETPVAKDVELTLKVGIWDKEDAEERYAVYLFKGTEGEWLDLTKDGDDYKFTFTAADQAKYDHLIFCRMDGSKAENNWDNKWNQTADLQLEEGKTIYQITDWAAGEWKAAEAGGESGEGGEETPEKTTLTITLDRAIEEGRTIKVHAWNDKGGKDYEAAVDAEDSLKLTAEIDVDMTDFLVAVLKDGETEYGEGWANVAYQSKDLKVAKDAVEVEWSNRPAAEEPPAAEPEYKLVGLGGEWGHDKGEKGEEVKDDTLKFQLKWELELEAEAVFKISDGADAWYGADKLEEGSAGVAESESSSNIKLAAGKYTVYFKIYNDDHIGIYVAVPETEAQEIEIAFTKNLMQEGVSSYAKTWEHGEGDQKLQIVNFNNNSKGWDYIKAGSKNGVSTAEINTKFAVKNLSEVDISLTSITASNVNSVKILVSSNADFSDAKEYTVANADLKVGTVSTKVEAAEDVYVSIVFDLKKGSANGFVVIDKVIYK